MLIVDYYLFMENESGKSFDVVVVGAGAAGQMAAISAADRGLGVCVLEQMDNAGLKILASGGGRCNFTNLVSDKEFMQAFGRQGRFMSKALGLMGPVRLREFFESMGVKTVSEGNRVYPASHRARDIQNALRGKMRSLGVNIQFAKSVISLLIDDGKLKGVKLEDGAEIFAKSVILACGGLSYSQLGATGKGYTLAREAGHSLVEPVPAGVGLITAEDWVKKVAGVAIPDARVRIPLAGQSKAGIVGDVLFTHRGVSGPAILDISGEVGRLLLDGEPVPLEIRMIDSMSAEDWAAEFAAWRTKQGKSSVYNLLRNHIPARLAGVLVGLAGLDSETKASNLTKAQTRSLSQMLGGCVLTISKSEGFSAAFVTSGGVKLKEVKPDTLESKRLAGLYMVGEMLDLHGPCGGYNLQWAFCSGYLAGKSV